MELISMLARQPGYDCCGLNAPLRDQSTYLLRRWYCRAPFLLEDVSQAMRATRNPEKIFERVRYWSGRDPSPAVKQLPTPTLCTVGDR